MPDECRCLVSRNGVMCGHAAWTPRPCREKQGLRLLMGKPTELAVASQERRSHWERSSSPLQIGHLAETVTAVCQQDYFSPSGRPLLLLLAQEKTLSFSVHWCTPGTTAALPLSCLCLAYLVLKKLCLHLPSTGHTPSPRIPGHKFLQHQFCFRIFVRVWVLFCLVFFCGLLFFWFFFLAKCRLTFQGNVCCSINFFSTCLLK